jgi:tetratricopeptide (TPR) repeat protein
MRRAEVRGRAGRARRARMAVLATVIAVGAAFAQPAPAPPASSYADLLRADRAGEGFVARQLREAKTYPYLERGNRLLAEGRREEARSELAAYLQRDPADVKVRYEYGVLLASLGDAAGAAREMTRVLKERPGFGPALLYRANARQRLGNAAGALDDFRAARPRARAAISCPPTAWRRSTARRTSRSRSASGTPRCRYSASCATHRPIRRAIS